MGYLGFEVPNPGLDRRLLLGLLLVIVGSTVACSRLFFYPERGLRRNPDDIGVRYENVHFVGSDGVQLHGWFLPASKNIKGTVLFLHGNAENISTHVGAVYWLPDVGYNVFIFDYRGFGLSEGAADIAGVNQDALSALRYLATRHDVDKRRMVLFGQSIGGAIALYTAAKSTVPIRAVVAESVFTSYPAIMQEKLAALAVTWPFQWMAKMTTSRYDPAKVISEISPVPVLLIHGDKDKIIPLQHAQRLYAAARGDKQFWIIQNGGHIQAFGPGRMENRKRLIRYFDTVLCTKDRPSHELQKGRSLRPFQHPLRFL